MYDFGVFDPYGQAARMGRLTWPQGPMEEQGSIAQFLHFSVAWASRP